MPLFASFEQKIKQKKMPQLGFPNYFIVNKMKKNVAQVLPTMSCVTWWLRHLDASMRSWVQTHLHEFLYLVVYTMHIYVYVYVYKYGVRRAQVGTHQPTILSHNNVLTRVIIGMLSCGTTRMLSGGNIMLPRGNILMVPSVNIK